MIRISQAGACPRRVELEAWGVEGEPLWEGSERAFAEGNLHEADILRWAAENLPNGPYSIFGQQTEVSIEYKDKELLKGHIDGLAIPVAKRVDLEGNTVAEYKNVKDELILLEAKTLANRGFQELREKGVKEAHPQYYTQVQLYLHALGLDKAYLVARNKETPKTRLWDHYYELIEYDKDFVEAEIERLAELNEKIENHIEINTPFNPEEHWQCRRPWCPYSKLCHPEYYQQKKKEEVLTREVLTRDELTDIIAEYNEITEEIKQLEERQKELKEQLLASAQEKPVQAGNWIVQVVERRQERFDTKLARQELPQELLQKLLKISTYQVLKIEEV
jgi:predicted phage-related endonuclease